MIFFTVLYVLRFSQSDKKIVPSDSRKNIVYLVFVYIVMIFVAYVWELIIIDVSDLLISVVVGIFLMYFIQGIMFQKMFRYLIVPIFVTLFYFFYIKTFHNQLYFESISLASFVDMHIGATVTPGFLMGSEISISNTNYGLGMNFLIYFAKIITDYVGLNLTQIGLVSLFQITGTLLGLLLIKLFNTRSFFFFGSLFIVINIAATNLTINLITPNQSILRYFIFLVQIVLYFLILKKGDSLYLTAALCAVGLIFSPSLGVIFVFGALANRVNFRNFKLSIIEIIKIIFYTITMSLLAIFSILKLVPFDDTSLSFWLSFVNGFAGYTSVPSITFYLLLFVFSNLILVLSFYKTNLIDYKLKFILFLSIISIIWMLYYVNRMFDQNLWFVIVLFSFIFILLLDEILRNNFNSILIPTFILMLFFVSYQLTISSKQLSFPYSSQKCDTRSLFSDICFNPELTDKAIKEFDYLIKEIKPTQSLILTGFPSELRILGYNRDFPYYSLLADAFTNSDVLLFSERIDNSDKDSIILHTNQEFYFYPPVLDDYINIVKSLKNYKLSYSTGNFEIYEKFK
jgi:hypothetical protein